MVLASNDKRQIINKANYSVTCATEKRTSGKGVRGVRWRRVLFQTGWSGKALPGRVYFSKDLQELRGKPCTSWGKECSS